MKRPECEVVRARGLRKLYGSGEALVRAVDAIDLEVARGETLAVMGPSGCGKSTLLHLLGGLDRPTAGELWLNGRRIERLSERTLAQLRRHEVGFVFQAYHLMDELTAQENVELPALLAGRQPAGAVQDDVDSFEPYASLCSRHVALCTRSLGLLLHTQRSQLHFLDCLSRCLAHEYFIGALPDRTRSPTERAGGPASPT
jgi:predicted ABC-type transport system involved in lysophospholipase L1 biosynthesis ATPase subunit